MQETIVRLEVLSTDQSPDQITATVGLSYDHCWYIGDKRAHTIIKEEKNGWVLGSGLPKTAALEEHIEALFSMLDTRTDAVKSLTTKSEVVVSCVVYADTPPALYFDETVINRLARLGASLDVDLYINESDASRSS